MERTALLATRDASGLKDLCKQLSERYDYRLLVVESVGDSMIEDAQEIDWETAFELLKSDGLELVVANYREVTAMGREFLAWQSALPAFDHLIADLIRRAACRPGKVAVIGNPNQYPTVSKLLAEHGGVLPDGFKVEQACDALHAASHFDASLAQYLETQASDVPDLAALGGFPRTARYVWRRSDTLRSGGKTSRQNAALYGRFEEHMRVVSGPSLDFECVIDVSLAIDVIGEFEKTTAAIIQKGRLLAAASSNETMRAIERAIRVAGEALSNGVLVVNGAVDGDLLAFLEKSALGTVVAPRFLDVSRAERLRLMVSLEGLGYEALHEIRSVAGGALVQEKNRIAINPLSWRITSAVQPLVHQWEDMIFAVKLSRHAQSASAVAVFEETVVSLAAACPRQRQVWNHFDSEPDWPDGTVIAFDETLEDTFSLEQAKRRNASVALHPGMNPDAEMPFIEKANQLGLALVATGTPMTKL